MKKLYVLLLLLLLTGSQALYAQSDPSQGYITGMPRPESNPAEAHIQVALSIAVLAFGLVLTLAVLLFSFKLKKEFGDLTFKLLGVILILTASLFMVVAGYSLQQITPVIGLLGTIAGFVFGSNLKSKPADEKKEQAG